MFHLKTREGERISQSHTASPFTPLHCFTLTQKYSRFIKRAVSHCDGLAVCPGLWQCVRSPQCDAHTFIPLNFTHHELCRLLIAHTAQMAHHHPISTTPMPGRAAKSDSLSEESFMSAHLNGDEMNLGVPQIRRVQIITK